VLKWCQIKPFKDFVMNKDSLFAVPEMELPPVQDDDLEQAAEVVEKAAETGAVKEDKKKEDKKAEEKAEAVAAASVVGAAAAATVVATSKKGAGKKFNLASVKGAAAEKLVAVKQWVRDNKEATAAIVAGVVLLVLFLIWFFALRVPTNDASVQPSGSDGDETEEEVTDQPKLAEGELICYLDEQTEDPIYFFNGFGAMSARRLISFTTADLPYEMSQDLVYTLADQNAVVSAMDSWTGMLNERYSVERGFNLSLEGSENGAKAAGSILLSANGKLLELKSDEEAAQFGLVPDVETRENGEVVKVANYSINTLQDKFTAQGWRCSVTKSDK
jgi:hypothetical protein